MGYRYRNTGALGFDDRQGILQLPSPAVELFARRSWLATTLQATLSPDFSGVSSLAASRGLAVRFDADGEEARTKTIVQREGYFFGWGVSASTKMGLSAGPFWTTAQARWTSVDSIEGLDRAQETVTNDIDLDEIITEYEYVLGVRPANWVGIAVNRKVNQRLSWAGANSTSVRVEQLGFSLHLMF